MNLRNQFWRDKSKDTNFINDLKKFPELKQLIKYDKNFNNKRKVAFESALAGIIRKNPRFLYSTITKVAKSLLPDFIDAFNDENSTWLKQYFYNFFDQNADIHAEFTGKYEEKINPDSKNKTLFQKWILGILSSQNEKDSYQQLLLIREYGNYFLRPYVHMPEFKDLNNGLGIFIVPEGLGNEGLKCAMRELWRKCFLRVSLSQARISTKDLPRAKLTENFGIFDDENSGFDEVKAMVPDKITTHLPGKNLWRATSASDFAKHARYELDMPLIASSGGSIALLLIPAMIIGKLTQEELLLFNLCAISYMIGNGHHAFHEYSIVWQVLGVPYINGDYASIFPKDLLQNHPELFVLQQKFGDLLTPTVPRDTVMPACF